MLLKTPSTATSNNNNKRERLETGRASYSLLLSTSIDTTLSAHILKY